MSLPKHPLVPIFQTTINNEETNSVQAKELYETLEIKKDYSTWIKNQIKRADLVQNTDFVVFTLKGGNPAGGRPEVSYILTLDSAKHIAMMSQSKKAKVVREYFIAVEKEYIAGLKAQAKKEPTLAVTTASYFDNRYDFNIPLTALLQEQELFVVMANVRLLTENLQELNTKYYDQANKEKDLETSTSIGSVVLALSSVIELTEETSGTFSVSPNDICSNLYILVERLETITKNF